MKWFEKLRASIPVLDNEIYLNVALNNLLPDPVRQAVYDLLSRASLGDNDKKVWAEEITGVRLAIAKLIDADPSGVAFTKNTTEGLNILAQGLDLQPGENVVVTDQEHPNNLYPWLNQKTKGVEVRIVKAVDYRLPVDLVCSHIDQNTRAVAISSVQFCSGFRVDLKELARRCHQVEVPVLVDGIQSLGTLGLMAEAWDVDAVACGGHKGLLGPAGAGFLFCRRNLLKSLINPCPGMSPMLAVDKGEDWRIKILDPADARRLEGGTHNFPGIYGLGAAINLLLNSGVESIEQRVLSLTKRLNQGLRELGFQVISPPEDQELSNITVLRVPEPADLVRYLSAAGIRVSLMDAGVVRFSLHAYTLESELDYVLETMKDYGKIN